jgi:hypothetical protein
VPEFNAQNRWHDSSSDLSENRKPFEMPVTEFPQLAVTIAKLISTMATPATISSGHPA